MDFRGIWNELQGRRAVRVGGFYAVAAWVLIQVVATVFPILGFPPWASRTFVITLLIGFPIAVLAAWATEADRVSQPFRHPRANWRTRVAAVVVVAAIATGAWLSRVRSNTTAGSDAGSAVAVFPFVVSGTSGTDDLGASFAHLLGSNLDGAGGLRRVDPVAVRGTLPRGRPTPTEQEAATAADELDAPLYVTGEIVRVAGRLRVNAELQSRMGSVRAVRATAEGRDDEIMQLVDDIARKLLSERTGFRNVKVTASTTRSLAALRAYLDGEAAMRVMDFGTAIPAYERAVQEDSTFALAYYRLGMATMWQAEPERARRAVERARAHEARLGERERGLLSALHAFLEGDGEQAEAQYREIVRLYPSDVEAWYMLGETLLHYNFLRGRSPIEARIPFERALSYQPEEPSTISHLLWLARWQGHADQVRRYSQRYLILDSTGPYSWAARGAAAMENVAGLEQFRLQLRNAPGWGAILPIFIAGYSRGTFDPELLSAVAAVQDTVQRPTEILALREQVRTHAAIGRGRLREADRTLTELSSLDEPLSMSHRALLAVLPWRRAPATLLQSNRDGIEQWDVTRIPPREAAIFLPQNTSYPAIRLYLLGLLALQLNDRTRFDAVVQELARMSGPPEAAHLPSNYAAALRAAAAWQAGNPAGALREIESMKWAIRYEMQFTSPFYNWPRERYLRAEALARLGRYQEALRWFESFDFNVPNDVAFVAPTLLRRAELYERLGNTVRAAAAYAHFVELWSDADPELQPLVQQARGRLVALSADARHRN